MFTTSHFHPMLVHFPIALVTFGYLAVLVSVFIKNDIFFSKASFYLLILGTLSAIVAVFTGVFFTADMSGAAGQVQSTHELFAFITLGFLGITSVLRIIQNGKPDSSMLKWSSFAFYTLAVMAVSVTGFFGGNLVYNYMMPL